MSLAIGSSDLNQRKTYEGYAIDVLKGWAKKIKTGDFYVYSHYVPEGERVACMSDLINRLMELNKFKYPSCLEGAFISVLNTMYDANSLQSGALCGIIEETKGTFRSGNEATKLENALKGAWKVSEYWKLSHSYIATLKTFVDGIIEKEYSKGDRISIAQIYNALKVAPYGFMPCNLTAFILGFILKEYANGFYSYSDNLTTVPLDSDKLSSMIAEIISGLEFEVKKKGMTEVGDNAATAKLNKKAYEAMQCYLVEEYGNPSQAYSLSRSSKYALKYATFDNSDVKKTGFTRMTGALLAHKRAYVVYNTRNELMKGFEGGGEIKAKINVASIAAHNADGDILNDYPAIIFGTTNEIAVIMLKTYDELYDRRKRVRKRGTTYYNVHFFTLDANGVRQLRQMKYPDWEERILTALFDKEELSYGRGFLGYDAYADGIYWFSFLNGDICGLRHFRGRAVENPKQWGVICFSHQLDLIWEYVGKKINVGTVTLDDIEKVLFG